MTKTDGEKQPMANTIREYISSPVVLVGALIVGFSLYSAITDLPQKYRKYTEAKTRHETLETTKNSTTVERNKMNAIAKELDKYATRIVEVQTGHSPQLDVLSIAQRVATLSEETQNAYLRLEPVKDWVIDTEKAVTLPINADVSSAPSGAPAPAAGTSAPAAPEPPAASPSDAPQSGLKVFEYNLSLKGTYVNLATFINTLSRMDQTIIIKTINLLPGPSGVGHTTDQELKTDEIAMTLTFLVPWK